MSKFRLLGMNPSYEPQKWNNAREASCYMYAMNAHCNSFYLVGGLLAIKYRNYSLVCRENAPDEVMIRTLKREAKEIFHYELEETTDLFSVPKGNRFKIYFSREYHSGYYHFYRQDRNGKWSHKDVSQLPEVDEYFFAEISRRKEVRYPGARGWGFIVKKVGE